MMKRTMTIVLAAAVALSMTACSALDAILQVNILKGLAALKADDIAEADTDTLLQMSESTSFYEALAEDDAAKAEVLATIDAEIGASGTSIDTAADQELAVLAVDILLRTTAAAELVNNVADVAADLLQATTAPDFQSLISTIAPDSLLADDGSVDPVAFSEMIDSLLDADAYYRNLGTSIDTLGAVEAIDGDVAQSALIAAFIDQVSLSTLPEPYESADDTSGYLYDLLTSPTPPAEPTLFVMPDMESGYLGNLLAAAGLSFS
jgi:hypothetical protein